MQIRCSKSSCMEKENRLYSISLGVASFAGWFGRCRNCFISCNVQAISSFLVHHFFVGLELVITEKSKNASTMLSMSGFELILPVVLRSSFAVSKGEHAFSVRHS